MKLELGKTYRARNGELVKIENIEELSNWPFRDGLGSSWREDGSHDFIEGHTNTQDLIELVEEQPVKEETQFKVGDKVYSIRRGVGVVSKITIDETHPVDVDFSETCESFTFKGKELISDINPTLFTISEALAKGYDVPVTKCKKSRTFLIRFNPKNGDSYFGDIGMPPGLNCFLSKEVTFEWEEEI